MKGDEDPSVEEKERGNKEEQRRQMVDGTCGIIQHYGKIQ